MTSDLTKQLIKERGWTYVPEHDGLTGELKMLETSIPECWVHEEHGVAWNIDDVLEIINDQILLDIERELND